MLLCLWIVSFSDVKIKFCYIKYDFPVPAILKIENSSEAIFKEKITKLSKRNVAGPDIRNLSSETSLFLNHKFRPIPHSKYKHKAGEKNLFWLHEKK